MEEGRRREGRDGKRERWRDRGGTSGAGDGNEGMMGTELESSSGCSS